MLLITCPECTQSKPRECFSANIKKRPKCKECRNRRERQNYTTLQDKARQFRYRYGIELDEYWAMYNDQKGQCAICGDHQSTLDVDHNHETGAVRQLLCRGCNVLVGMVERKANFVNDTLAYLDRHGR